MKEITELSELKKIELDALIYVDEMCRKNKLKYFLACGTLLGAVRHKGFIPWDDDIDIFMPRTDYEKLCTLLKKEDARYQVLEWKLNKEYIYPFAKVVDSRTVLIENDVVFKSSMGVYIDIFPYDRLKDSRQIKFANFMAKMRNFSIRGYKSLRCTERVWRNGFRWLLWLLLKIIGNRNLLRISDMNSIRKKGDTKEYCCFCCSQDVRNDLLHKEDIAECIEVEFEGHMFFIPKGYHNVLKNSYGDYMKLPAVEERVSEHNFRAWHR